MSKVLLKYYGQLKNQFVSGIAISEYPTIQWMDFGNIADHVRFILIIISGI